MSMDNLNENINIRTVKEEREKKDIPMVGRFPENSILDFKPSKFPKIGDTGYSTNYEMCIEAKKKFGALFHDLVGMFIDFVNGTPIVQMYFSNNSEPVPEGKIKNVVCTTRTVGNDRRNIHEVNMSINNSLSGNYFSLSDETKLFLSDYMISGRRMNKWNNKAAWDKNILPPTTLRPAQDPVLGNLFNPNAVGSMIVVSNIDIYAIMKYCLYGADMVIDTEESSDGKITNIMGTNIRYKIRANKLLNNNGVFSVNLERFDADIVRKITISENPSMLRQPTGYRFF